MSKTKNDIVWTVKVDKNLDAAVQEAVSILGFTSKAELSREAVREFLIRHKLFSLLGGKPIGRFRNQKFHPKSLLHELSLILKKIPKKQLDEEVNSAQDDVEKILFNN